MKSIVLFSLIFAVQIKSHTVFAQETSAPAGKIAESSAMKAVLCIPMVAQITQLAYDEGTMSYKRPVFTEALDAKLMEYLVLVKDKSTDMGSAEIQTKAMAMYAEAGTLNTELAKACEEFSTIVMGNCSTEKDTVACLNERSAAPDAFEAAKNFALKLKDDLMVKTEMKAATDLLVPLMEKKESLESTIGQALAQFVANHYLKIFIVAWIFILGMVVIGVRRFRK